ncbi:MAG: hypothetical protein NT075_32885 [Chloroflexi bacterium]|nr:hypothetical protein [Chloroflexota bacterium]
MSIRRDFLIIVIIILLVLIKPTGFWREIKQIWGQRERLIRVLVVVVGLYFLYGLYTLYSLYDQGWFVR